MNERQCRRLVAERAGGECERCGRRGLLTLHHRKKRSQGGEWSLPNCVMLCGHGTSMDRCHSHIEDNPNEAELEGWHVRPWQHPEDIPVNINGNFVYLLKDGEML